METALTVLVGIFFGVSVYLMLSRHTIRILLGIVVLGNSVNLLLFTSGRLARAAPPIIPEALMVPEQATVNPLPQALVLTAIVISFSFFAFLLVLAYRAYQELGTDDTDEMRLAEPKGEGLPPMSY